MRISKTREMLVDVARTLFAEQGFHNTTMNDIAAVSKKGRRTLYTYFKNKDEVYIAVIERELTYLLEKLRTVAERNINPERKLIEYIFTRLDAIKELIHRNGTLRSDFFNNVTEVERARRKIDIEEQKIIRKILQEGVEKGIFYMENIDITVMMIQFSLRGVEVPYIKDNIREKLRKNRENIIQFLLRGLKRPVE
ncbi:MAG: TetR/AcrR family transcriptional regulator [Prevotellaceae bacterium]|nr:TetR/AcrR family transcriptional regulator [Prevotellaceae bacterium]